MRFGQRTLLLILLGLTCVLAWRTLSRGVQEIAVLHTSTFNDQDHFAAVWVVDDGPYVWIRAEDPARLWLPAVREEPGVSLRRGGRQYAYRATVWDTPDARAYVDPLFRAKYGLADQVRALFRRSGASIVLTSTSRKPAATSSFSRSRGISFRMRLVSASRTNRSVSSTSFCAPSEEES